MALEASLNQHDTGQLKETKGHYIEADAIRYDEHIQSIRAKEYPSLSSKLSCHQNHNWSERIE